MVLSKAEHAIGDVSLCCITFLSGVRFAACECLVEHMHMAPNFFFYKMTDGRTLSSLPICIH